jgi:hypothetical protein
MSLWDARLAKAIGLALRTVADEAEARIAGLETQVRRLELALQLQQREIRNVRNRPVRIR